MKLTRTLLSLAAAGAAFAATGASAQVNGIATSSPEAAIASAAARTQAYSTISTTYATQIQQIGTLRQQARDLQLSLDSNGDGQLTQQEAAANPGVQQQLAQLQQQIDTAGRPAQLAQIYVIEQIIQRYDEAQTQVVQQKGIQLMLTPEVFQYAPQGVDVTQDLVTAINALVPTVNATPPANYQPSRSAVETHQAVQQLLLMAAAQQQQQAAQQQQPSGR